jgi:hypothetical protein
MLLSWGAVLEVSNDCGSIFAGITRPAKREAPPTACADAAGPIASSPGLLLLGNLEVLLSNASLVSPFPCIYEGFRGLCTAHSYLRFDSSLRI